MKGFSILVTDAPEQTSNVTERPAVPSLSIYTRTGRGLEPARKLINDMQTHLYFEFISCLKYCVGSGKMRKSIRTVGSGGCNIFVWGFSFSAGSWPQKKCFYNHIYFIWKLDHSSVWVYTIFDICIEHNRNSLLDLHNTKCMYFKFNWMVCDQ